uniref:Uncharacterized protein n=1 Tax=Panagrolaimus sp. PS1159 TaxID=55785 RepID=A0AC35FVC2_9BILA
MGKGFTSSLPYLFNQFIGIFENYFFVAADTDKELRIYKKELINTDDWKICWTKSVPNLLRAKQCINKCNGSISVYGITKTSILCFYGFGNLFNPIFKFIQINLQTFEEIEIECSFEDTDFFIEHLSDICNTCQNSKISCRNFNESLIILTHFKEYLTTMSFEIDFLNAEIFQRQIKFSVTEIVPFNYGAGKMVSNVAINSVGVVAIINGRKMFCAEFKCKF